MKANADSEMHSDTSKAAMNSDLFRFDKVRDVPVVIDAANVEASSGPLTAEAGHEARLRLPLRRVDRTYLYAAAHHPQQPSGTVDAVAFQVRVQRPIPGGRDGFSG